MKIQVNHLTGEERERFILLYIKKQKSDFDLLSDLNNTPRFDDDVEIDLYFEYRNEIASIQKIVIDKNNIIRTLFGVLVFIEEDENALMSYNELYEIKDDALVLCQINDENPLIFK